MKKGAKNGEVKVRPPKGVGVEKSIIMYDYIIKKYERTGLIGRDPGDL